MSYHFFVHHEWFFQNLGKEAVRTNMHTTVALGQMVVLKISDWAVKYATIEVKFLIFFKYCSIRTNKLHNILKCLALLQIPHHATYI